jgi:DNA (cytosine-5)-methyltransferase 1
MALSKTIKIGTDCSGMEAPVLALRKLRVKYEQVFSCDIDAAARATIEANFTHGVMYNDITERDNETAPHSHIYVAGFPCQPFSAQGDKKGFSDERGRGKIFFNVLDYIRKQRPRVFILENVKGILHIEGGKYVKEILSKLNDLKGYNVQWQVLNTKDHGIPHSRGRWYCVGILEEFDTGTFSFPEPIETPSIENFLEKRDAKLAEHGIPPPGFKAALINVKTCLRKLREKGIDPTKEPYVVDCDSTPSRSQSVKDYSMCITARRCGGHWLTNRGRRMVKEEMMRLQGMDPTAFNVVVRPNELGKQLGNTMSVNVLERLFVRLLPAAKLVRAGTLKDRWTKGQAVKTLARTRGLGFKSINLVAKKRKSDSSESGQRRVRRC